MSFILSMEIYNEVFNRKEGQSLAQRFVEALRHYLQESDGEMEKSLLEWIDDGGNISAFRCSNDIYDDMADTMCVSAIPCVRTMANNGKTGIIIRNCDKERTERAIAETLQRTSHVFTQMNEADFKKYASRLRDAGIVSFYGLSEVEAEMLLEKLGKVLQVDAAEMSPMEDGTYRISISGKDIIKKGYKREKLTQMFLLIQMSLAGKNRGIYNSRMKMKLASEMAAIKAASGKNMKGRELYLVGDNRAYLRYDEYGFTYGRAEEMNGHVVMHDEGVCTMDETDYVNKEAAYRGAIAFPIATYSAVEAVSYLQAGFQSHVLGGKERMTEKGEMALAEKIDRMAEKRLSYTDVLQRQGNWGERLTAMQKEAGTILAAAITGQVPKEYSQAEIQEIRNMAAEYHMDLSDYAAVAKKLQEPEIFQEDSKEISSPLYADIVKNGEPETARQEKEEKKWARDELGL